jgi:hypothetical protein
MASDAIATLACASRADNPGRLVRVLIVHEIKLMDEDSKFT